MPCTDGVPESTRVATLEMECSQLRDRIKDLEKGQKFDHTHIEQLRDEAHHLTSVNQQQVQELEALDAELRGNVSARKEAQERNDHLADLLCMTLASESVDVQQLPEEVQDWFEAHVERDTTGIIYRLENESPSLSTLRKITQLLDE